MTRQRKKLQKRRIILALTLVAFFGVCVAGAWASVTFVKPVDGIHSDHKIELGTISEIPQEFTPEKKSNAPEPATMALFGGGFFGMVMSFLRRTYAFAKRIFDLVFSIVGIILISPLLLVTAILVRATSKGPAIYTQERVGKDGKVFNIYKFRSMRIDAEKETGPVWAAKNDSRITSIGKFLRKSRIDELPQLWNVIKGEMSIIGPRPERQLFVDEFKKKISNYEKRLAVKPGITGLAQVWHRYDETLLDVKKKVKYDRLYIRNMTIWSDLGICLRTIRVMATGFGAR